MGGMWPRITSGETSLAQYDNQADPAPWILRRPSATAELPAIIQSSDELEQLRARLRKMPDDEQVRFGKAARSCAGTPRCPDTFKRQVEEARTE
jgi:hypothetical protein